MRLLALVLLAAPLAAQIEVVCGPLPVSYSKSIFDRKTAKNIQPWSCVLTNLTPEATSVSEAAVQGWMLRQGVSALSAQAIRLGAGEIKRRGVWSTTARVLPMAAMLGTALLATEGLTINERWIQGAFAFGAFALPQVGDALGDRNPNDALFEQLALDNDIPLDPGKSVSVYMWSAPSKVGAIQGLVAVPLNHEVAIKQWEGELDVRSLLLSHHSSKVSLSALADEVPTPADSIPDPCDGDEPRACAEWLAGA